MFCEFTPQHGASGWSEMCLTSGVAQITKEKDVNLSNWPHSHLISDTQNVYHFLNTDPKMAIVNNLYHAIPETFLCTLM